MSAQQQQQHVQPRPPQLQQQQQPWWANPLTNGIGSALQGMQHNLQQLANSLPKPPGQQQHQQQQQQQALSTLPGPAGTASTSTTFSGTAGSNTAVMRRFPPHGQIAHTSAAGSQLHSKQQKQQQQQAKAVTKEELGRATWVFLHTLAAQFPERPSRQQQRDARQLMDSFARIYPCADCAQHFQEIVRRDPPDVSSGAAFSQWMCRAHNAVNRRLGKPTFNCDLVGARWTPLDCDEHNSCDMTVGRHK